MRKQTFLLLVTATVLMLFFILSPGCGGNALDAGDSKAGGKITMPGKDDITWYRQLWGQVEDFKKQGRPKSALEIVDRIYEKAKKEKHAAEFIKALVHKLNFIQQVEEDAFAKINKLLAEELKQAAFPVKQVLHSMAAEQYWNYYQQNRYRFLKRTPTEVKPEDIRTWDMKTLVESIVRHYHDSLENAAAAKKTPVDLMDTLIVKGNTERKFRPTLYDFLAHRAVDFFMDSESGLTRPVYEFTLNNADYFLPARELVKLEITSRDTMSFDYLGITLLQDLIKFHLEDKTPDALVDVDLKRLRYIYREAAIADKEAIYEKALRDMMESYGDVPVVGEIYFHLAELYNGLGEKYQPGDDTYKWHKKKALEICGQAIKKFPGSIGAHNCTYLAETIKRHSLALTVHMAETPGMGFTVLAEYKNTSEIFLKVVPTDREEKEKIKRNRDDRLLAYYLNKKRVADWNLRLPDDGDYQFHRAEIKIDALEPGEYVLLAAEGDAFDRHKHVVTYTFITVSPIAYVSAQNRRGGLDIHVMDRDSGQPLKKVQVQVWARTYNRATRQREMQKGPQYTTDANGFVHIPKNPGGHNYFHLEFIQGDHSLFEEQNFYGHGYSDRRRPRTRTFFFTDRAIYRPGQTVYFKGIALNVDNIEGEQTAILPNHGSEVTLQDPNGQKVGQLNLSTNEFGTFSGSFQIPTGRINGNWLIKDGFGNHPFKVEEYKRPKFEVKFQDMKETYKLGDTVTVKGKASAYAGYAIDKGYVKYRVVRRVFFPFRWCWWGFVPPDAAPMEIINGETETNEKGEFEISFKAVPDLSIPEKRQPAFTFAVHADVTDINGETRGGDKSVSIGYRALKLGIGLPDELDRDKNKYTTYINTTTLSGESIPAAGNLDIYILKEPGRLFRSKNWKTPDKFTMKREEYYKLFPLDSYADEYDYHRWEKGEKVLSQDFDTAKSKSLELSDLKKWKTGKYMVEMTANDRYGAPVKEVHYFTLYSLSAKKTPYKQLNWFTIPDRQVEPGETAVILVGSSAENVTGFYEIEHRQNIVTKKYFKLNNNQIQVRIPVEEKHRGNFGVHVTLIKHNRLFRFQENITVPWSNKDLDISFETFRDKLKPGEKEEWRIRIKEKNSKGQSAAAEMLAALYDASLDAFVPHRWSFAPFPSIDAWQRWMDNRYFGTVSSRVLRPRVPTPGLKNKLYDHLNWFGFYLREDMGLRRLSRYRDTGAIPPPAAMDASVAKAEAPMPTMARMKKKNGDPPAGKPQSLELKEAEPDEAGGGGKDKAKPEPEVDFSQIKARTNLRETAFFYPHLRTDEKGEIVVAFTIPEALTRWKMLGIAHTKDLQYGLITKELVTQKDLMVEPNAPRFFREGDRMTLTAKITNLSENSLKGQAKLMLMDSATMEPVDAEFKNDKAITPFSVEKDRSTAVSWDISIPREVDAVTYRIVAQAGNFSDGEEKPLPVLKNRILVTESLPLPVRENKTKSFEFEKLVNNTSPTLSHHRVSLEFTANPVWYAVQALPYMMEYPHECLEQIFSRFYANGIAHYIVNAKPGIKRVFEIWQNAEDSNALLSNLEKNLELKSVLLEETPWVLDAKDETERKKRVAMLFDLNRMATEMDRAMQKLKQGQAPSGGWPWFKGMRENRFITQYIVCGFAHLERLGVIDAEKDNIIWSMLKEAVPYLDRQIGEDYQWLLKNDADLEKMHIGHRHIQYLYARSYFGNIPLDDSVKKAHDYYKGQSEKYWLKFNKYMQGMIALAHYRWGNKSLPPKIVLSLKEHALHSEEMGMYWKEPGGFYWYRAPIEKQALLIEVFHEVSKDAESVNAMRTWLLKQKQTQDWGTTKATAAACYALMLRGTDWLEENKMPEITIGKTNPVKLNPLQMDGVKVEAGTGYFKTSWSGKEISPDMGHVTVKNNNNVAAWGSLYWQYFEDLDKITPAETPLKLKKELFVERPTDTGPVLKRLEKDTLKIGDRVKVRIELRVDREMEFVHMKDMRAAGFEPENVLSHYKWQDGLGYYESTKDAATHFFFDFLPKGTYVFEYPLRVNHSGDFSNGITSIQCMYAPEFTSHSKGVRVKIKN